MNKELVVIVLNTSPFYSVSNFWIWQIKSVNSGTGTQLKLTDLALSISDNNDITLNTGDFPTRVNKTLIIWALEVTTERVVGDQSITVSQSHISIIGSAVSLSPLVREDVISVKGKVLRWYWILVQWHKVAVCVNTIETIEIALELSWVECVQNVVALQNSNLDINDPIALQVQLVNLLSDNANLLLQSEDHFINAV